MRLCKECGESIEGTHFNRKFCSTKCYEKSRYKKYGVRSNPEERAKWYKNRCKNPGYREKLRKQDRNRYYKVQHFIRQYKIKKRCTDCGYDKHHVALSFDHVKCEKKMNVCKANSIKQAKKEIEKCEVVCFNCHTIRTYNRIHDKKKLDIFEKTYEEVK